MAKKSDPDRVGIAAAVNRDFEASIICSGYP